MNDDWDQISYVIASSYRVEVLGRLAESPATPSRIAADTDRPTTHVSRPLPRLREPDPLDRLASEQRQNGRVHGITPRGQATGDTIDDQDLA